MRFAVDSLGELCGIPSELQTAIRSLMSGNRWSIDFEHWEPGMGHVDLKMYHNQAAVPQGVADTLRSIVASTRRRRHHP